MSSPRQQVIAVLNRERRSLLLTDEELADLLIGVINPVCDHCGTPAYFADRGEVLPYGRHHFHAFCSTEPRKET